MTSEFQLAFVLHTRPYRDTSMLVDFLTPDYGRVTAVVRGVRARKTPKRNLINPFTCLLISFQGKTALKFVTQFEAEGAHYSLTGKHLYSGFYLNEILVRILVEQDAHPDIFCSYQKSLAALAKLEDLEVVLRCFELSLLNSLGYGIQFDCDAQTAQEILPNVYYSLDPQLGFYNPSDTASLGVSFLGQHLLAIARSDFTQLEVKNTAKIITRVLLKPLLGNKPLQSRSLFTSAKEISLKF